MASVGNVRVSQAVQYGLQFCLKKGKSIFKEVFPLPLVVTPLLIKLLK